MSKHDDDKLLISLSDLMALLRKSKDKILWWVYVLGFAGFLFTLSKPIKYKAEGTFREKSSKSSGIGNSLAQMLAFDSFSSSGENEAEGMIKSRKLMSDVITTLNLQGQLSIKCGSDGFFTRAKKNIQVEWAKLRRSPFPTLEDTQCPLYIDSVVYSGEVPIFLEVHLDDHDHYRVLDARNGLVGEGDLDIPFITEEYSFILSPANDEPLSVKEFSLNIIPMASMADGLTRDIEVESTKLDKGVLKISYVHPNRFLASRFVNTVMESYQDYLKQNHDQIALVQMEYLYKKKKETAEELSKIMQQHANLLSKDLSNSGFADSRREMEFLAQSQHQLKEQLLANELEIKRLKNIQPNNHAYYDQVSHKEGNPVVINTILTEIRHLKQERDGLELALRHSEYRDGEELEKSLHLQLKELETIQAYRGELQKVIQQYRSGEPLDTSLPIFKDPRFLLSEWTDHLKVENQNELSGQKTKESFMTYLVNLERLFNVHEKILEERLTHQQKPTTEYQGMDIQTARELYIGYCKQLNGEEASIRRTLFVLNQMENPDFEITSLSSVLTDPVSLGMIGKASQLVINIRDQNNQSVREQERLREELDLQRTFLVLHLQQMVQLMEINKKLINEKIYALQNTNLELIHQRISLLEKNLNDYVQSRLENLHQERAIIKQHLGQIRAEMALLPKKWISEQLVDQQVESNQMIVKEIAKIVESKNISHNLEVIQSAPIDSAIAPVHPISPGILLYSIIGAFLGGIVGTGIVLAQSLARGLLASESTLKNLNLHVSGRLSTQVTDDLSLLRRLLAYFESVPVPSGIARTLLLIEGEGPHYVSHLAQLLHKRGQKVLTIDLNIDRSEPSAKPALLQFLQKEVTAPTILHQADGDYLPAGGASPFASELLTSQSFKDLLHSYRSHYDWILAFSHSLPHTAETENLVSLFPFVAVTLQNETVDDLGFYFESAKDKNKKFTFIFSDIGPS